MANYSVAFIHAAFSVIVFLFEGIFRSIKCSCNENNVFPFFNKCGGSAAGLWKAVAVITSALQHTTEQRNCVVETCHIVIGNYLGNPNICIILHLYVHLHHILCESHLSFTKRCVM
jgi:hypothetical protein